MTSKTTTQRSYMALAPLSSLAGIFINPLASTIAPLILFFIFRNKRPNVSKVAIQTADLAFSIQLWIVLISLAVMLGISLGWIATEDAKLIMSQATSVILILFVVSLLFALYQALNHRTCSHIFSFKIAERVFKLINSSDSDKSSNSK